jgi:hypothetical protein
VDCCAFSTGRNSEPRTNKNSEYRANFILHLDVLNFAPLNFGGPLLAARTMAR